MSWLLLLLIVTAGPAAEPGVILVLANGQAMRVQSYEVKDALVHIVGPKGEPLIMRTERVDLEQTEALTARLRALMAAEAEAERVRAEAEQAEAEAKANKKSARDEARPRKSGGGTFQVLGSGESAARPVGRDLPADGKRDEQYWRGRRAQLEGRIQQLEQRLTPVKKQLDWVELNMNMLGTHTQGGQAVLAQYERVKEQIEPMEEALERAKRDYREFKEAARKEGVPPGWLR